MIQTLITWLPLLLCPLMMLLCMGPMLLRRGRNCGAQDEIAGLDPEQVRERLAALQREELALREQLVSGELDTRTSPPAAPVAGPGGATWVGTP